jgi:multidrug efflux pump subunit AcrB
MSKLDAICGPLVLALTLFAMLLAAAVLVDDYKAAIRRWHEHQRETRGERRHKW